MVPHTRKLLRSKQVSKPPHAHLVGATGAGMKGLAEVLLDDGWNLTGSDQNPDPERLRLLRNRGIALSSRHCTEAVSNDLDLIIYSAAIPASNIERQQAEALDIPQLSYSEAVARLANEQQLVAIAGTHGKSSTTALVASLFERTGTDVTFFCGAQRCQDQRNGKLGNSEVVVVEACEYQRHFLNFQPTVITLLGIEADHFDCFPSLDDAVAAYAEFVQSLPESGTLVYRRDCEISRELAQTVRCRSVSFSITSREADWFAEADDGTVQLFKAGALQQTFPSQLSGKHSLLNLLAASTTAAQFNIDLTSAGAQAFFASPARLKQRFEILASTDSRIFVDDYAHHPTEIEATLQAAREHSPRSRIVCIFQPHQLSRTQKLHAEFVESLALADAVYLLPVFRAREPESVHFSEESQKIVKKLISRQIPATFIPSLDQVWSTIETDSQRNDVVLTLGAGDLTRIHNERTR
ncbi:UDP-N-acetylmuramate--L-alanine ligase [Thalassoglobus polymorphus]|uniref:UDP-N-acetylmuramate--L-alanine ligase n=1 Tax=Thalassoglobus polymorphus TaxID=2527994 RepID=A0A517QNC2_9PLAN|nr:UDP-N-acetylmuramate--L-alanine ligase [Thalassoglobus polymorphus]QDT33131.1 UDP-N-acetylmuramate--L-alanine ligase MurC [Thalassoglobus polymorphus]